MAWLSLLLLLLLAVRDALGRQLSVNREVILMILNIATHWSSRSCGSYSDGGIVVEIGIGRRCLFDLFSSISENLNNL